MINKASTKQTLVVILMLAAPAAADPPGARARAFEDWRLDCAAGPCGLYTAVAGADGSEVLRIAVTGGAAPTVAVTTPVPLFLPDGVALALGERPERPVPWRTCGAAGCEATLPLDSGLLDALRHERGGSATFTLVDGVQVRLGFSLMGFSAAVRAGDLSLP
jgi:invasion protein IalB